MLGSILIRMARQVDDDRIKVLILFANLAGGALFDGAVHQGFGHTMAARKTASPAVAIREQFLNVGDPRIFLDVKELSRDDHRDAKDKTEAC